MGIVIHRTGNRLQLHTLGQSTRISWNWFPVRRSLLGLHRQRNTPYRLSQSLRTLSQYRSIYDHWLDAIYTYMAFLLMDSQAMPKEINWNDKTRSRTYREWQRRSDRLLKSELALGVPSL